MGHVKPRVDDSALASDRQAHVAARGRRPRDRRIRRKTLCDRRALFDHDIRAVTGTTCWFPVLFEKVLAVAKQRGLDATTICQIWPNLRLLIGGGVSANPYRPLIRRQVGQDVTLVDTYNATEGGIYASSDFTSEPGLLVMPHRGVFFEFVPMDDIESPSPRRVPLWRVERNRPYAIVVTTSAGMYAYRLGDIVRFPSVSPLHIEYMGRLSGCLSVTQELTTHVEVQDAVAEAVRQVPCTTIEFAVGPEFGVGATGKSRYVLLVEFSEQQLPADADAFVKAFDASLCQQNRGIVSIAKTMSGSSHLGWWSCLRVPRADSWKM